MAKEKEINPVLAFRRELGITQTALAQFISAMSGLEITGAAISNYELNKRVPSRLIVKQMIRLAKSYKINLNYDGIYKYYDNVSKED